MAFVHLELVLGGIKQPSLGCRIRELAHDFDVVCASLGSWFTRRSKRLFTFAYWHGSRYSAVLVPYGEGSVTSRSWDSDQMHWPNTASAPPVADYAMLAVRLPVAGLAAQRCSTGWSERITRPGMSGREKMRDIPSFYKRRCA